MISKIIGVIIIVAGILGAVAAGTADMTGLNVTQDDQEVKDFGWLQTSLVIVGVIIFIFGIVFTVVIGMKKPGPEPEPDDYAEKDEETASKDVPVRGPPAKQAETAEDLYGSSAQTQQDMYAETTATPAQDEYSQQQSQDMYAQTPAVDYSQQGGEAVDFSAGAPGAAAQEADSADLLDDLDGLDGLEDLAEELGEGVGTDEVYECPDCGAELSASATSCSECGAEFSEEIFECPVCGAEVPEEANECPKCGEEFEEDEEDF